MSTRRTNSTSGGSFTFTQTITSTNPRIDMAIALAAGNSGTILSQGGGTITLASGHDIPNGATVDLHWVASGVNKLRYGCSAAIAGNTATLSGGTGDALPADGTSVVLDTVIEKELKFNGSNLEILQASFGTHKGVFRLSSSGAIDLIAIVDGTRSRLYDWAKEASPDVDNTSPVAGDSIVKVSVSNGSTTATACNLLVVHTAAV